MGRHRVIGGLPPEALFTDVRAGSGSFSSTRTFTSVPIGAAEADRLVVCIITWASSAARYVISATIGGISASVYSPLTSYLRPVSFIWAVVPTGTTATIVVNTSGNISSENIATYRVVNLDSPTPHSSDIDINATSLSLTGVQDEAIVLAGAGGSAVTFDPPIVSQGTFGTGIGPDLTYGQINESPPGTVNLTFTTAFAAAALAWR